MAFKDLFKKQPAPGPQIVQAEKKSAKKEPEQFCWALKKWRCY